MRTKLRSKLHSESGISWLIAILLAAVLVLSVTAMIPTYRRYQEKGKAVACATALDTARRQLASDFMIGGFENGKADEAKGFVSKVMNGWDDLCPDYGTVYIVRRTDDSPMDWDIVCGLHCSDKKLCTRLNADYVLEQLKEALKKAQADGVQYPESLTYTLHGKTRTALLVDASTNLKRGTSTTSGYEGIVAFYSIVGHSDYGAAKGKDGALWYFSYADENHCANWSADKGWTGDSYR